MDFQVFFSSLFISIFFIFKSVLETIGITQLKQEKENVGIIYLYKRKK